MVPITAVAHANVNCADLARSLRFYTALLGLRAAAPTAPAAATAAEVQRVSGNVVFRSRSFGHHVSAASATPASTPDANTVCVPRCGGL